MMLFWSDEWTNPLIMHYKFFEGARTGIYNNLHDCF